MCRGGRRDPRGPAAWLIVALLVGLSWAACNDSGSTLETSCNEGSCPCDKADKMQCCPGGTPGCAAAEIVCRPKAECAAGAGGAGGAFAECTKASDCTQAGDPRCGTATCTAGACGLEVKPLGKLASQIRGDCVQVYCDGFGNSVVIEDGGDVYDDGAQCSLDLCKDGVPVSTLYQDGTTCPETQDGVCRKGNCVPCIDGMTVEFCAPDDVCDGVNCVPLWCNWPKVHCGESVCSPCGPDWSCAAHSDCYYGVCGPAGKCLAPTCTDGVHNGDETGVDCGADTCGLCPDGDGCKKPSDCQSKVCWAGKCQVPACDDGFRNGQETGIDCGGPCEACP